MSRMSRRSKVIVALCVLVVAVGVAAAVVVTMGGGVTVPDVTGKTEADATQALEDAGLSVGDVGEAADPDAEPGTVVRQDPAAGEEVDEGSAVGLTLSSGPATAKVPDVTGMTEAEAQGTLQDAGFASASASQYDLTAPAGEVLAQLPEAGQEAVPGSPVGLLVSKGRPEVTVAVPDVTGMTAEEATTTLADAALTAVPVEAYVPDVPAGDVADQEPAPGALVTPLSEVLVTVSLGEGTTSVTVPDVVGSREADAADELEAAGLVVTTGRAYSADVAAGRVIAQAPEAGASVDEGAEAGLLVSLGELPSPSPTPTPSPSATAEPSPRRRPRPSRRRKSRIRRRTRPCRRRSSRTSSAPTPPRPRRSSRSSACARSCWTLRARARRPAPCTRSSRRPAPRSRRPTRCSCSSRPGPACR